MIPPLDGSHPVSRHPPSEEPISFEAILSHIQTRFSSPTEVSEVEIESFYEKLFEGPFKSEAQALLVNKTHIASMIYDIHQCIAYFLVDPSKAKVSTELSGQKGINGSYFLCSAPDTPLFVFKPSSEEAHALSPGIPPKGGAAREHLASFVNDNKIFPIPFTTRVQLFDESGSIQQVVPGKSLGKLLEEDPERRIEPILKPALQRKLVFDIIFGNCDGHEGNLLCTETSLYSIDHGNILSALQTIPLQLPYIRFLTSLEPMDFGLFAHCKELPILRYQKIATDFGIEGEAISLMRQRATLLQIAISKGLTLQEIALPFILNPAFMDEHSSDKSLFVFDKILELRQTLIDFFKKNDQEGLFQFLTDREFKESFRNLLGNDSNLRQLWTLYIKPLLFELGCSKTDVRLIGGVLT